MTVTVSHHIRRRFSLTNTNMDQIMSMNDLHYEISDLPSQIPVFPLAGALVFPRGQLPLNIFEPRYLSMVDDALRSDRLIGMIQPESSSGLEKPSLYKVGCAARITHFNEIGDGRYSITLTGVSRFRLIEELMSQSPYRVCAVSYHEFRADLSSSVENDGVDRTGFLRILRDFATANRVKLDWEEIERAPNETLVNALSMMSPFGASEKQALLEAASLKERTEVLIAITEIELARSGRATRSLQ